MTITYDPHHPKYFDDADLREELTRVYDLCHGCRLCFKYCTSFPTLFDFVDRHDDQDAAKLTRAEQDQVVDECFNCKLCYVNCPYIPGQSEWELDFPRLMLRAKQVRQREGDVSARDRVTDKVLGNTDATGKLGSATAGVANKLLETDSAPRRLIEKATGVSAQRVLPPYAAERFSTWFNKRPPLTPAAEDKQGDAILFPTCQTEYVNTGISQDMVKVSERNNIECSLPQGERCCGAPFLHEGDVDAFVKAGEHNVEVLAKAVRAKQASGVADPAVVVMQPTCGYVVKFDYPDYLSGSAKIDAELVAAHTYDGAEYLMKVHKGDGTELDTEFSAEIPEKVTYHAPCHLRAQNIGLKSRDLIKLTGTKPTVVAECSGIDGMWGLRATNVEIARGVAKKLTKQIDKHADNPVVGDCTLANGGIELETGTVPQHPISFLARAYGIAEESK